MSGQQRGFRASILRGVLSAVEPIYRQMIQVRNRRFDAGKGVRRLPRTVISIGNITAGGTGKTPVVRWLCEQLRAAGHRPAILMRGYKSTAGISDEQRMLEQTLNTPGAVPVIVQVNPDRFAGGTEVLRDHPEVDIFVLDDGFQHRRLARDFDVVLINATEPFGFGHVHPRGLLREPLNELRRADAVIITRVDEVDPARIIEIEREIAKQVAGKLIVHSSHVLTRLLSGDSSYSIRELNQKRVFAFCAIGDPESFFRQVQKLAGTVTGSRAFPDHHAYTEADQVELSTAAAGADLMVTTEKDWAKLALLPKTTVPIHRVEMAIQFRPDDEALLLRALLQAGSKR